MSRCPAANQLERFVARRLDPSAHAATADHVRDCPECRAACAGLTTDRDLETITLQGPPPLPPMPTDVDGSQLAAADAPTARLWRHELALRAGERPVQAAAAFDLSFTSWPAAHLRPTAVPGYEILGDLGRGGMGVVYKARQVKLNRLVALKMIHAGELSDPDTLTRFRTEAEAVARLQHPNIVQIYEVGEADGRPYFSLEYVGGGSLAQRAAGRPQPPAAAAALVETLAGAIHYAHAQGVVHRDLKPGNILLQRTEDGGQRAENGAQGPSPAHCPLSSSSPKIADFGLAKYTAAAAPGRHDSPTRPGLIVGTPQYMAPERAATTPEPVGPAADVYSLGAILYELLTGRPPFQGANAMDTLLQVRLLEPIPPRVWQPKTPRDLETIALKCLQKEPRHRYPSAGDLADDLRRFRDGVPIRARPASLTERAWKAARRHPGVTVLGLTAAAATVAAFAGVTWQWRDAAAGRTAAERSRDAMAAVLALADDRVARTERGLYLARVTHAGDQVRAGRFDRAAELLDLCRPHALRPDCRGWEWHYLRHACVAEREPVPQLVAAADGFDFRGESTDSPDGRLTAAVRDGAAVVSDAATGAAVARPAATERLAAVAFSPDGSRLAAAGVDPVVVLWDAATWQPLLTLRGPVEARRADGTSRPRVAFSRDGRQLAVAANGGVTVWDAGP